jgi:hypothetical protein
MTAGLANGWRIPLYEYRSLKIIYSFPFLIILITRHSRIDLSVHLTTFVNACCRALQALLMASFVFWDAHFSYCWSDVSVHDFNYAGRITS